MDDAGDDPEFESRQHELTPFQADAFVVGWISFLSASLGTMLLFAWVDPLLLAEVAEPPLPMSRMTGYAVGFFFLWAICLMSCGLCAYLIRTRHEAASREDRHRE
jgi:hypothetical protein